MFKKLKSFYPVLLVAFPILSLFGHNMDEVPAIDLVLPLLIAVVGMLIILLLLRVFIKSHNKIALILSWFIVLFFSYGYIRDAISAEAKTGIKLNAILLSVWLVLFVGLTFLIIKVHRDFALTTKFLCVVAVVIVAISLGGVGVGELKVLSYTQKENENSFWFVISTDLHKYKYVNELPDIYYIVLDMYARDDALEELFEYDNSRFTNFLSNKGFYVATESHSNYTTTHLSLTSSLNMDYLQQEDIQLGLIERMENNNVSKLLKSVGYRYIYVTGGVPLNGMDRYAEVHSYSGIFGIQVTAFAQCLCDTTVLSPLARVVGGLYGANSILYAFDVLSEIPSIDTPTFVYSHILCPHPPWFFESGGARNISPFGIEQTIKDGYLGNLAFVNEKVETLVDEIITKSNTPPIIVISGDHGLWWVKEQAQYYEILNAYYLPENGSQFLYESISPVNSFRVIFNYYFGTEYDLLEDQLVSGSGVNPND